MTNKKKESKLSVKINEDKNVNVTSRNKVLNVKKKKGCSLVQHCKKTSAKQKVKLKNTNRSQQKIPKKLSVSKKLLEYNEEMYKYQIQRLNQILKQSLNCPTLTQNELKMLFMKYKLDGHYRTNKNLPPFSNLLENTQDTINGKNHFHNEHSIPIPDVQRINCKNEKDTPTNLYYDTGSENQHTENNLSMYKNAQETLKYDTWKPKKILGESNVDNRNDNKYVYYVEQNSIVNNNYNHTLPNYDMQTCSNTSMIDDIQNFGQSKSNLNVNKTLDMEEEYFSYNLMNKQNILLEDYQNYRCTNKNLLCNVSDSTVQYKNLKDNSEIQEQNDVHFPVQYNDLSLNPNFCNDFHSKKWDNNTSLINKNSNYQTWKNEHSVYIPQINNLELYHNSKNFSEEQNIFNSHVHTNAYPSVDNENLAYVADSNNINVQQDLNTYTSNSTVMSDNYLPEQSIFLSSCSNVIDQYI